MQQDNEMVNAASFKGQISHVKATDLFHVYMPISQVHQLTCAGNFVCFVLLRRISNIVLIKINADDQHSIKTFLKQLLLLIFSFPDQFQNHSLTISFMNIHARLHPL